MGYTHYFEQNKDVPQNEWDDFKQTVERVFDALPVLKPGLDICNLSGVRVLSQACELFSKLDELRFNGNKADELDHEGFILTKKNRNIGFDFCKTNEKPYDWFVVAVLILVHNHCPDCFYIQSDGYRDEWQPVVDVLNGLFDKQYALPDTLTKRQIP